MKLLLLFFAAALILRPASYYVTIAGLGGDPEYEAQFARWAADLDKQLKLNGPEAHVETLSGPASARRHIQELLNRLAGEITSDDSFSLVMVGHGSFDGTEYKFNVPGPDITADDLRDWLAAIKSDRQFVANLTSCSGASLPKLVAKHRIVVTATKSGTEKNAPVFPRYFVDAFHDPSADTDKNGTITALEAFRYAQQRTSAYFTTEKLIASEHAQFSDNGSPNAVREPGPANQQGQLAAAFSLLRPPSETASVASSPGKQKLISHKDDVEAKIDRLKYQKASLPESEYKQQLTGLLIDLAKTQAEIDR